MSTQATNTPLAEGQAYSQLEQIPTTTSTSSSSQPHHAAAQRGGGTLVLMARSGRSAVSKRQIKITNKHFLVELSSDEHTSELLCL